MKYSELKDKNSEELAEFGQELRNQLVQLRVAAATSRSVSTAKLRDLRRDIARVETLQTERKTSGGSNS